MQDSKHDVQQAYDWFAELGPIVPAIGSPEAELLLPPLRAALVELDMGLAIKHPWVNMCIGIMVGQANKQLAAKWGMARGYLSESPAPNWSAYLHVVVERPWRMSTLEQLYERGRIDVDELRDLLPEIWTDTEMPGGNLEDPAYLWREVGFATDDQEEWDALPEKLTLWRGGYAGGISWTTDREKAEWFARRFATDGESLSVWEVTIDKDQALGYLTGRGESEVILPPEIHDWRL
jgi:hypothetical protein